MSRRVDSYRPDGSPSGWTRVGGEVRRVITAADPITPYQTRELLSALAQLALFCDGQGMPAQAEVWLSHESIERFIAFGCPQLTESTRGNYRSRLKRIREAVIGQECSTGKPVKLSASKAARPYTRTELAGLWSWAGGQRTEELRWGCKTLLALGAGCGLDSSEIIPLRVHDIRGTGSGPAVVAVRGPRAREVLCRRRWEVVLKEAAQRVEEPGAARYLFRPRHFSRGTNTVTNFLARTMASQGVPPLNMGRLRSTWLVELIDARLPLSVIVAAAGLDSLHGLSRILPYVRPVAPGEAADLLRGDR